MSLFTLPLESPESSLDNAGGKGLNLSRLMRAGFRVPPGFLITTEAYRAYTRNNNLEAHIQAKLSGPDLSDTQQLESVSGDIRRFFGEGTIPEALLAEIRAALLGLEDSALAVRSSATAEDLPDMSFAGQQDTFLNVLGAEALEKAMVDCWSSLWTARAIGYRARNGIPQLEVSLAVVVQAMVQSEVSGVLFTANPVNGIRHQSAIDATFGLGEALVGGHVEPDNYLVDTRTDRILRKELGGKRLEIRSSPSGGVERLERQAGEVQAISDETILALAQLGQDVQRIYNFPQDIEWATSEGQIYLLQSRPITSLYPLPEAPDDILRVYFSFGAVQGILDPITPLGQDTVRLIFSGGASLFGYDRTHKNQGVIKSAGERLWGDLTHGFRNSIGKKMLPRGFNVIEPSLVPVLQKLLADPRLSPERPGIRLRTLGHLLRFLLPNLVRIIQNWADPAGRRAKIEANSAKHLQALQTQARRIEITAKSDPWYAFRHRLALYQQISQAFPHALPNEGIAAMSGIMLMNLLHRLAQGAGVEGSGGMVSDLVLEIARGLPHNVTTRMDLDLWHTAKSIHSDPASRGAFEQKTSEDLARLYLADSLPATAQALLAEFMSQYGMRGLGEIDFGRPRWREDPEPIMQTIKSYMQIPDEGAPDVIFWRGEGAAEAAIEKLISQVRKGHGGRLKARLVSWAAFRFRSLAGLRESPKFHIIRMMGIFRQALLSSGQDLADLGVFEEPQDIFFLYVDELEELVHQRPAQKPEIEKWKSLVTCRRESRARESRRRQIPRLMLSDGQVFYEGLGASEGGLETGFLTGSPVSPGVVEGLVRVVIDPRKAALQPGEILVCPGTDPAWTPLFLAAGGLIMEVGGMMTHGSVVAREYGIPAVVGVDLATRRLHTGMRIRLDGSAGRIEVLEAQAEDRNPLE